MHLITGTTGIASIQGVEAILPSGGNQQIEIVKIAIQLIIGLITIIKLIKKPKTNELNTNKDVEL